MKFWDEVGREIEAEQFCEGNIDRFMNFLKRGVSSITIYGPNVAEIILPYGCVERLIIRNGDYVVKGLPIPKTIPQLYEYHVVNDAIFQKRYRVVYPGIETGNRESIINFRKILLDDKVLYNAFLASIDSALKELPKESDLEDVAKAIAGRIIGEE